MELKLYPLLTHESKLCIRRKKWKWGKQYNYMPNKQLLRRLAQETAMSEEEVLTQLAKEREFLLKYPMYFNQ